MKLQPKNYHTDGGDRWVVDGELVFGPDAQVVGFPSGADTPTWDEIEGKPAFATVATSGSYNDLSDLPTLGTAAAADVGDFATAAQGALADSAVQPGDLPQGVAVPDAAAAPTMEEFNALLTSLRDAGLIAT